MPGTDGHELTYSSWAGILAVAVPAVVQSVAAPLTTTLQTAWLGLNGSVALAAFSAVNTSAVFAVKIFIFFTDGVAAKVGGTVGNRDWAGLRRTAQLSLAWSASLGLAAALFLQLIKPLVIHRILDLEPAVLRVVSSYWTVRAIGVPIAMTNMACSGILQGLHHVTLCALLNTAQAVAESALSAAILLWGHRLGSLGPLVSLGWASLLTQAALLLVGLVCIVPLLERQVARGRGEAAEPLLPAAAAGEEEAAEDAAPGSPSFQAEPYALKDPLPASTSGPTGLEPVDEPNSMEQHQAQSPRSRASSSRAFLSDGVNMLLRSITLQATFFAALVAASRLGTAALAAHSVISQLWMLSAYAVDGFAAAGIVLGSRLAGVAARPGRAPAALAALRLLVWRCCAAGTLFGALTGAAYLLGRGAIAPLFTADPAVAALLAGPVWILLALMQPCNGLVFVLDGLMYASHAFAYVRNYMALGFALLFAPALALELALWPGLLGIWGAKAVYNFWRAAGGAHLVFGRFLKEVEVRAATGQAQIP